MSDRRDHKAEFGSQPTWDKQRQKQQEAADNYYERQHGAVEVPEPEDLEDE